MSIIESSGITSGATARPDVGECLHEFDMNELGFITLKVLTEVKVKNRNGSIAKINEAEFVGVTDTDRAPNGGYTRGVLKYDATPYSCVEHGHEIPIDDSEAANVDSEFDATVQAGEQALDVVLRNQERRGAALLFDTATFTPHSISNEWDDHSSATPIDDVNTGKKAIRNLTGIVPNVLVVSYNGFLNVCRCSQIIELIKYGNPNFAKDGIVTEKLLAQVLGLRQVLVGDAVTNSVEEGLTPTLGDIWNDEYALLCCVSNSTRIKDPCLGRTLVWSGDCPGSYVTETYRDENVRSDIIRVRQHTVEQILLTACGYLMANIITH